jgi:LPXTG-motif cell wall-anchored protein
MKTAGIFILIVGLVMTLYTGFTYVTKEKVVDLGGLEISKDTRHTVNWQPYVGIGLMVLGGAVLVLLRRKSQSA